MRYLLALLLLCARLAALQETDVEYGTADGVSLKLDLSTPDGDGPFPACILVHGGGWIGGDKARQVRPLFGPLHDAGYAWFSINYRLAPAHRYPACLDDVKTAIRWVKAHAADYHVDPARIALIGESAGGQLVSMIGVLDEPDTRLAAIVPFYAPNDLLFGGAKPTQRNLRQMRAVFGIEEPDAAGLETLRQASPVSYLHGGLPPFLLLHGTADPLVDYQQSVKFRARLLALKVPCELITVEGGVHGMVNWDKNNLPYKPALIAWLDGVLK